MPFPPGENGDQTLNTDRLHLRPPGLYDLEFMTALYARPELVAHRPVPEPDSAEASAQRLARSLQHWSEHGFGIWAIEAGSNLIGFGGLTVSPEFDALNISYHIDPAHWGQGYATELVRETLRFAAGTLRASKIIGLVRPANPASRRVLEKAGFSFEKEIIRGGAPTNLLVLALQ